MSLFEIVLVGKSADVRVTDQRPKVGQHVVIDHVEWVVQSETAAGDPNATARFLLTRRLPVSQSALQQRALKFPTDR